MKKSVNKKSSEHGGAGVKFLLVAVALILAANAGYQFIPVAYNGESFKQEMQTAVIQGVAVPVIKTTPVDVVKGKIQKAMIANDIPLDASVEVKQINNIVNAHVTYTKEVPILPFGLYNYEYHFDHTATPSGFVMKN